MRGWLSRGLSLAILAGTVPVLAQPAPTPAATPAAGAPADLAGFAPDRPEPGSVEKIREYTTAPEFLPESVAYVPDSETVPSPEKVLGHLAGAPDELSRTAQIYAYFRRLAQATDRVKVETIGTSEEGREILLVQVSNAENLKNLDRYKDLSAQLADPRRTTREAARALAAQGKVFYYLTGAIHSPETGSPEMLMELAYRLAVSEKPEIRAIRENAIVLITPVVEVDGRDRQVDWYYRNVRGKDLPWEELSEILSPPYWGHYVLHDNNRDGMQRALALSRAVDDAYWAYHPQVMHDLHESIPLLYVMTGYGPYNHAIDPVTINEWTSFAHHEAGALAAQGLPGVWVWGFFDGWWPGYMLSVAHLHNSVGRFYETFGNSSAGTFDRKLDRARFAGHPVTDVQWYRPWPPKKKLRWSLRDNTNYMEAGVLSGLSYAALHREELLYDFWIKGDRSLTKGRTEPPYAWIFPTEQRDAGRLAYLIDQLRTQRIEVQRLNQPLSLDGKSYPAGSYVVRTDQPYGGAAKALLEIQKFPEDEPNTPYDDVGWTWPLLYGVQGTKIDDRAVFDAPMQPVGEDVVARGRVQGEGDLFLVRDTGQNALLRARLLLGSHQVDAAEVAFEAKGVSYPPGSWIVQAPRAEVAQVAEATGLDFTAAAAIPDVRRHLVDLPRLAVLHVWTDTQDAGWVRYTLDQEKVPYTLIAPEDLRKGGLGDRFDVILFPNARGDFADLVQGIDPRFGPLPYTPTPETPSLGIPDASPDITGGMGFAGLQHLQEFVEGGGVLVALGNAGTVAVDGGMVRKVGHAGGGFNTPGSILQAKVLKPLHPIAYGYGELPTIFRGNGPIWDVADEDRGLAVLQFGTKEVPAREEGEKEAAAPGKAPAAPAHAGEIEVEDADATPKPTPPTPPTLPARKPEPKPAAEKRDLLVSGFVKGKDAVDGKPAILDVPTGKGRMILFAFNPLHRYLNHSDFRFVYNVILNWNDLPR
jgi:Zinc carboxypeptidase